MPSNQEMIKKAFNNFFHQCNYLNNRILALLELWNQLNLFSTNSGQYYYIILNHNYGN